MWCAGMLGRWGRRSCGTTSRRPQSHSHSQAGRGRLPHRTRPDRLTTTRRPKRRPVKSRGAGTGLVLCAPALGRPPIPDLIPDRPGVGRVQGPQAGGQSGQVNAPPVGHPVRPRILDLGGQDQGRRAG